MTFRIEITPDAESDAEQILEWLLALRLMLFTFCIFDTGEGVR